MKSGAGYQVWRGSRRNQSGTDVRGPVIERHTPDVALRAAQEYAREGSLYLCITRDGEEWATIAPDGDVSWLQGDGFAKPRRRW